MVIKVDDKIIAAKKWTAVFSRKARSRGVLAGEVKLREIVRTMLASVRNC